jgi:hypothetical protein
MNSILFILTILFVGVASGIPAPAPHSAWIKRVYSTAREEIYAISVTELSPFSREISLWGYNLKAMRKLMLKSTVRIQFLIVVGTTLGLQELL